MMKLATILTLVATTKTYKKNKKFFKTCGKMLDKLPQVCYNKGTKKVERGKQNDNQSFKRNALCTSTHQRI